MFEDEIYDFYRALLSGLPEGTALLTRRPSRDVAGEDIELTPSNPRSARIYVHPMGDWIYASIGKNTSMEFFQTWQKEEKALEDLKAVTRAVIDGNFSEDIWSLDGKIVKSSGVFEIDGKKRRAGSSRLFFNPFRRTERQHFDYEPYSQDNG